MLEQSEYTSEKSPCFDVMVSNYMTGQMIHQGTSLKYFWRSINLEFLNPSFLCTKYYPQPAG